jgi:hypothetical protein
MAHRAIGAASVMGRWMALWGATTLAQRPFSHPSWSLKYRRDLRGMGYGSVGVLITEFWPDVQHKLRKQPKCTEMIPTMSLLTFSAIVARTATFS